MVLTSHSSLSKHSGSSTSVGTGPSLPHSFFSLITAANPHNWQEEALLYFQTNECPTLKGNNWMSMIHLSDQDRRTFGESTLNFETKSVLLTISARTERYNKIKEMKCAYVTLYLHHMAPKVLYKASHSSIHGRLLPGPLGTFSAVSWSTLRHGHSSWESNPQPLGWETAMLPPSYATL